MNRASAVVADDGLTLAVWTREPSGEAKGIVQILHGMAEHAGRYERLADRLAEAGYVVVVHDQRGHGESAAGRFGHLADEDGWSAIVDDAVRVGRAARAARPGLPLILLGHSMGSVVARCVVQRDSAAVDALVLSGPPAASGVERRAGLTLARLMCAAGLGRRRNHLLDRATFGSFNAAFEPARTRFDWISSDTAEVDAYVADPRSGFVCTTRFFADLLEGVGQAGDRHRTAGVRSDLPVYVLAGDEDPAGRCGASVSAIAIGYHRAGLHDVATRLYRGGRHEMFNEVHRDVVTDDLLAWIDRVVERRAELPVADVIPLRGRSPRRRGGRSVGACH